MCFTAKDVKVFRDTADQYVLGRQIRLKSTKWRGCLLSCLQTYRLTFMTEDSTEISLKK